MNEFKIGDIVKIKINQNSTCCFGIAEYMFRFNDQICVITDLHKEKRATGKGCDGYAYYIKPLYFHPQHNCFTWTNNLMVKSTEDNCWED